jgi:hypothetical protein
MKTTNELDINTNYNSILSSFEFKMLLSFEETTRLATSFEEQILVSTEQSLAKKSTSCVTMADHKA